MAKEIIAHIKLQIPAGSGESRAAGRHGLGPRGVNIMAFCKEFNAATQKQAGDILPVVITVFKDKSFTFITKTPAGCDPVEKGRQHRGRFKRTEQNEGRKGHPQTGDGDREN